MAEFGLFNRKPKYALSVEERTNANKKIYKGKSGKQFDDWNWNKKDCPVCNSKANAYNGEGWMCNNRKCRFIQMRGIIYCKADFYNTGL